jgi:fibronectin type 3 domain-containing protein
MNYGDGYIMVTGLPNQYKPSTSYLLTVSVCSPGMQRYGFEITAVATMEDHPVGSWMITDSEETQVSDDGNYIKNTMAGCMGAVNGVKTWNFQWVAPSRAESTIVFYGTGVGGNGGNGDNGDIVYCCSMMVLSAPEVPEMPAGVLAEPGDGYVVLSWYMPPECDPTGTGGSGGGGGDPYCPPDDEVRSSESRAAASDSYNIYWSDQSSGGLKLLTTTSDTTYIHTGLLNGRTYRYQVAGANSEGEGPLSDLAKAIPAPVPDKPRHISANLNGEGAVVLSWDDPATWGSGTGNAYNVFRGETPYTLTKLTDGLTAKSYVDSELPAHNKTYYYRVSASTSVGEGATVLATINVPPGYASFPLDLSAVSRRDGVELMWLPPSDDGGDPVQCYNIYRAPPDGSPVLVAGDVMDVKYLDASGTPGVQYEYTVAAVNVAGEGAFSTPVAGSIIPPPEDLSSNGVSTRGVPLSGLVAVGAVLFIGAMMVARLSLATRAREQRRE